MSQGYRFPFDIVPSQIKQVRILPTLARPSQRVIRHIEFPTVPSSPFFHDALRTGKIIMASGSMEIWKFAVVKTLA